MNIPCFFCQAKLRYQELVIHHGCLACCQDPIYQALTTYRHSERRVIRGHLYLLVKNKDYHIRCWVDEKKTEVERHGNLLISLPGFPITPNNALKKLQTILTFL
jgi:hypothetical protein